MRKFKEGDNISLDDVRKALQEAHDNNISTQLTESVDISHHLSTDGYLEFDSWEEYKKIFGDFVSVEEAFK